MLRKFFAATAITGAALFFGFATAGTAAATPSHGPDGDGGVSILNNLCVAPWQWNGPIEVLTGGHSASYAACNGNGNGATEEGGVSILDNLCVAPWQWNGPLEALTVGHTADYVACNGNGNG
jgi:hypothetical protein